LVETYYKLAKFLSSHSLFQSCLPRLMNFIRAPARWVGSAIPSLV